MIILSCTGSSNTREFTRHSTDSRKRFLSLHHNTPSSIGTELKSSFAKNRHTAMKKLWQRLFPPKTKLPVRSSANERELETTLDRIKSGTLLAILDQHRRSYPDLMASMGLQDLTLYVKSTCPLDFSRGNYSTGQVVLNRLLSHVELRKIERPPQDGVPALYNFDELLFKECIDWLRRVLLQLEPERDSSLQQDHSQIARSEDGSAVSTNHDTDVDSVLGYYSSNIPESPCQAIMSWLPGGNSTTDSKMLYKIHNKPPNSIASTVLTADQNSLNPSARSKVPPKRTQLSISDMSSLAGKPTVLPGMEGDTTSGKPGCDGPMPDGSPSVRFSRRSLCCTIL